jgi:hypothetical protein
VDDDSQVRCKICDKFSISHGGQNDIMRHAADPIHKTNVIRKNTNKLMTDFVMHSSVFQNLKVNDRIIVAACPAHILHNAAKKAADKMAVDVEVLVAKVFNHFSSSAKRTAALKSIFAFLDNGEKYSELLHHATTR